MNTTYSKDGTLLAYDVSGNGPALIYITGATCFRSFKPILDDVKEFSKEFSVYSYDRRGRGDSGDTLPYATQRELEDLEAVIDSAGGKAFLYGHSSGAVLALEAALQLKNKVSKVVLYDTPYVSNETEKKQYSELIKKVENHLNKNQNAAAIRTFLQGIGVPKIFTYLMRLMPGWNTMVKLAPTLMYDMELTRDLPPLIRVQKITVPLLVAFGQKSPSQLKDVAEQLKKAIPHAEFVQVDGQDHMISAKVLLSIFTEFFKK